MKEPGPREKTAARYGLAFVIVFLLFVLVLRFIYVNHRQQFVELYEQQQLELAKRAAGESDRILRETLRAITTLGDAGELTVPGDGSDDKEVLEKFLAGLEDLGVLDLAVLGTSGLPLSASGYIAATGMSSDELRTFLTGIGMKDHPEALISEIIQMDTAEGEPGYVIMVAVPVMLKSPLAADGGAETDIVDETNEPPLVQGMLVAPVSVEHIDRRIQKIAAPSSGSKVFALDRNGFFVSYPEPEFVGAQSSDALNLPAYPRLQAIVETMRKGDTGTDWYTAPDAGEGRSNVRWHAAFAPTNLGKIFVAAAFQRSDTPFMRPLLLRYVIIGLVFMVAAAVATFMFIIEKRRYLDLQESATRLGDTSAVNEMLTTINSDLTEEKKQLELHLMELRSINKEREARIRNLVELEEHLTGSIRRPSRTQRNLMSEMQRELKLLLKPPENRFRRRQQKDMPELSGNITGEEENPLADAATDETAPPAPDEDDGGENIIEDITDKE